MTDSRSLPAKLLYAQLVVGGAISYLEAEFYQQTESFISFTHDEQSSYQYDAILIFSTYRLKINIDNFIFINTLNHFSRRGLKT